MFPRRREVTTSERQIENARDERSNGGRTFLEEPRWKGSEAHCFEGDILIARMTSSTLTVVTVARSVVVHGVNIGGAAVAVAARTPAIFESMKSW